MLKLLCLAAALSALSPSLDGQSPQRGTDGTYQEWRQAVPLDAAARLEPILFVGWLVEAGIPVGIELFETDLIWHGMPVLPRPSDINAISPGAAAEAFNAEHVDFRAVAMDGVLVIRPVNQAPDYLDGPAPAVHVLEKGLMRAGEQLFAPLNAILISPGGRAGSYLGPVGVNVDRGDDAAVDIDAHGLTILAALNLIERQVPGHAWLVIERNLPPAILRFGYLNRYQTTTEETVTR